MQERRIVVPAEYVVDCRIRQPAGRPAPSEVFLLLHGYQQTGKSLFSKLEPVLPAEAAVVAPNGPFPVPEKKDGGWRLGFAWYFYDPAADEYFIDPSVATRVLSGALSELGYDRLPIRIIGFSQGGYLSPFVAEALASTRQVIGIASEFLREEIRSPVGYRVDWIHGAEDEITDPKRSRLAHRELASRGVQGEFREIAGVGHRITPEIQEAVRELSRVPV